MKFILIVGALIVGSVAWIRTALQNGQIIRYVDTHPDPKIMPPVIFYVGEGYYLFRDLENSATYYQRVSDQYPQSSYADDAYFNYLNVLDENNTPRLKMAELYATYLEKYPQGKSAEIVLKRIENCRNNR